MLLLMQLYFTATSCKASTNLTISHKNLPRSRYLTIDQPKAINYVYIYRLKKINQQS